LSTHIYKSDKKDYHQFYALPNVMFGNYYSTHYYHTNSKTNLTSRVLLTAEHAECYHCRGALNTPFSVECIHKPKTTKSTVKAFFFFVTKGCMKNNGLIFKFRIFLFFKFLTNNTICSKIELYNSETILIKIPINHIQNRQHATRFFAPFYRQNFIL